MRLALFFGKGFQMSRILTRKEAARMLRVHPETLRRNARRGKIPGALVGGVWRFSEDELMGLVENGDRPQEKSR